MARRLVCQGSGVSRCLKRRRISKANVAARFAWSLVQLVLFRPTPRPLHIWRAQLLRLFGARVGRRVRIYATAKIWAPWNLEMRDDSCLGDHVDCYNVDKVMLMEGAVVSQYCFLCTASHDHREPGLPLVSAPIHIGADAWITADVFIGPGVQIGEGAVVLARSTVTRDLPEWQIATGSPARPVKPRQWKGERRSSPIAGGVPGDGPD